MKTLPELWEEIPVTKLGDLNDPLFESLPASKLRPIIAKRALLASYEDADCDAESAIKDCLSDLRHLCDRLGVNFGELDSSAYDNYLNELPFSSEGLK